MLSLLPILSLPFATLVLSASTPDLSVYPSCARPCLSDQIQKSKCYSSDSSLQQQIACLCTDTGYLAATTKCVTGACSPSDGQTTYMVGQELCQQAGVSEQQYSSAALGSGGGASATSSPSGSSSAAASGSGAASAAASTTGSGSSESSSASGSGSANSSPTGTETSASSSGSSTAASDTGAAAVVAVGEKTMMVGIFAALLVVGGLA